MGNILNNNFHEHKLRLDLSEFWDFHLYKGELSYFYGMDGSSLYDTCLIAYIDTRFDECTSVNDWLYSTSDYKWESAVTSNYVLHNVGYTALDNGLIQFRKDRISNKDFVSIYSGSTYNIEDDYRLKLHAVSGCTLQYDYPLHFEGDKVKLNGGFYQGFFKTECDKYFILPSKMDDFDEWEFDFTLKKSEFEKESDKTLNDRYPNNKGIFFYIGTRAENKWAYLYNDEEGCKFKETKPYDINDYAEIPSDIENCTMMNIFSGEMLKMPPSLDEIFFDDYVSYKYYDEKLYENTVEDAFDDFIEEKPKIIDETQPSQVIGWCCNYIVEKRGEEIKRICCGCGSCKEVKTITLNKHIETRNNSSCDLFGDDFLAFDDDLDYDSDYIEEELDITNFTYDTYEHGFTLNISGQYYVETDNKFLLFDRTCDGFNVHNWVEGTIARYYGVKKEYKENPFLLFNRTCTGYTVHNIDKYFETVGKENYDVYKDIYNNALAFRITDDGEIGYRYCMLDCDSETKVTFREGYSKKGMVKEDEWVNIHVKITSLYSKMVLRFYVNENLVFVTDPMPKLDLRALNEQYEKQETVPFNMSLGGGTQGLAETILPNYMENPYRVYPLEENFGGTFIGYIRTFKFFNCPMEYSNILNNFKYEIRNLK